MTANLDQTTGFLIFREFINSCESYLKTKKLDSDSKDFCCLIELPGLDKIGEQYGQQISENILFEIAKQLNQSLKNQDCILGRLDRKSLAAFLPATAISPEQLGDLLVMGFNSQVDLQESSHTLKIWSGISPYSENMTETLNQCRIALGRIAKGTELAYSCFTDEDEARLARSRKLTQSFIEALHSNSLELHFQPQISTSSHHLVGAEALLRWTLPEFGAIAPPEIIQIAQNANMARALDSWVMEKTCQQLATWAEMKFRPIPLSVNLMGESLEDPLLINRVQHLLDKYKIDPSQLHLEILETAVIEEFDIIIPQLEKIKALGISFSLDDFGTGYSSLRYLQRLPVKIIKIDKGFIQEMMDNPEDAVLTSSIISLSHGLGMEVIAEGVETLAQYTLLKNYNCDIIQGHIFSKALPAEQITQLLAGDRIYPDPLA